MWVRRTVVYKWEPFFIQMQHKRNWEGLIMSELHVHAGVWLLNINVYFQSSYRFKTRAKIQQSGVGQSFTIFRNSSDAGWVRTEWRGAEAFFWAHGSQFRGALGLHHHWVMIDSRGLLLPLTLLEIPFCFSCTGPNICICVKGMRK